MISKKTDGLTDNLKKQFKIVSIIIFAAYALTFLLFKTHVSVLMSINFSISFAVWIWLIFNYKILQVDKLYLSSLGIGLAIFIYGYLINKEIADEDNTSLILMGTSMPILFLIIQRPMRYAFKKILKREPKVEYPFPSFADIAYALILMITSSLIPAFYYT